MSFACVLYSVLFLDFYKCERSHLEDRHQIGQPLGVGVALLRQHGATLHHALHVAVELLGEQPCADPDARVSAVDDDAVEEPPQFVSVFLHLLDCVHVNVLLLRVIQQDTFWEKVSAHIRHYRVDLNCSHGMDLLVPLAVFHLLSDSAVTAANQQEVKFRFGANQS